MQPIKKQNEKRSVEVIEEEKRRWKVSKNKRKEVKAYESKDVA